MTAEVRSLGAWSRLRYRVEGVWNRHIRYRDLYRQLDLMRADLKARTAWVDELTEEELAEMLRGLGECIDAVQAAGSDVPDWPEGEASSQCFDVAATDPTADGAPPVT
ncbi:hypothetical protein ACFY12_03220 [Streptomyces sp. NPDC001339]|uniref:hypothetical protein n=1 Tax=Streptomyces sp. NPDC001339 TaxID=3364563 RepID=UPI0036B58FD4